MRLPAHPTQEAIGESAVGGVAEEGIDPLDLGDLVENAQSGPEGRVAGARRASDVSEGQEAVVPAWVVVIKATTILGAARPPTIAVWPEFSEGEQVRPRPQSDTTQLSAAGLDHAIPPATQRVAARPDVGDRFNQWHG